MVASRAWRGDMRDLRGYPEDLEQTVRLQNGTSVRIRPIRPEDEPRLISLYERLSFETAYQRFFAPMKSLPPAAARVFANVDYHGRLALVGERVEAGESAVVGVGRYAASPSEPTAAEIALVVEDRWQGLGLGTFLLREILRAGEERGLRNFRAEVLASNRRMLGLLRRHGSIVRQATRAGITQLVFRRREPTSVATIREEDHKNAARLDRSRQQEG